MKRLAVTIVPFATALAVLVWLIPGVAFAHGFGEKYDLPLPLSLYVTGAGLAVALSFVIVAVFVRRTPSTTDYPRFNLLKLWPVRVLASAPVIQTLRVLSVLVLLLVLLTGALGVNRSTANIAPVLVWVYWWVGIAFASALIGNVWGLINPVRTIYEWMDALARRVIPGGLSFGQDDSAYPPRWAAWPAVIVFALFAWFEIAYEGSAEPLSLAIAIIGYCMITWWGMAIFGADAWMRNADVFSLIFGVLARFAPTELRVVSESGDTESIDDVEAFRSAPPERRELGLRPPGAGLLNVAGTSTSYMILVVVLLSTVTFDGLQDTPPWARLVHSAFVNSPGWTSTAVTLVNTAGLIAFAGIFVAAYLLFCAVMARSGEEPDTRDTMAAARVFALSLVPIAFAYHLAHFISYLLIQGQVVIPHASDPFGFGWDLFGTSDYQVNIGIVNAQFVWILAIAAIVIGHVIAVFLAHVTALRHFGAHDVALRSQRAMLILMVGYTMVSLWILAQPITEYA